MPRIRESLAALEQQVATVRLAPAADVRKRGEVLRRGRMIGSTTVAAGVAAAGIATVTLLGPHSGAPVGATPSSPPSSPAVAVEADCGTIIVPQADVPPDAVLRCFIDAVSERRPARLTLTRPTVEGDPITTSYSAGRDGKVLVTIDSRQDRFGQRAITDQTCSGPVAEGGWLTFAECSEPTTR